MRLVSLGGAFCLLLMVTTLRAGQPLYGMQVVGGKGGVVEGRGEDSGVPQKWQGKMLVFSVGLA
jgi:hypothetical protein